MSRPRVLFHCQHSLGLGHLARTFAIIESLTARAEVVLLNGGRFPDGWSAPAGCRVVHLPPLGHDDDYELVSHDARWSVAAAREARRRIVVHALECVEPDVLVIEMYPFGRKKFAFELTPLLEANRARRRYRASVVCSVRDILVNQRRDQSRHDDRAARIADEFFDHILVHSDPNLATLEESFNPTDPCRVPVTYTGFVAPPPLAALPPRRPCVLVSAGGGSVGAPLLRVAAEAHAAILDTTGWSTRLIAGPFLPESDFEALARVARSSEHLELVRQVRDLRSEIASSQVSVSQCGYNTTMDLLQAATPAVVVPYSEGKEDEQRRRAERLSALGIVRCLAADQLDSGSLVRSIREAATTPVARPVFDLNGRERTAEFIDELAGERRDRQLLATIGDGR